MAVIPNLTIRELGYLVALADYEHFGRAAEACCVGQPTLSTQLSKLEKRLGVALFERTNKSVRITPSGQKIVGRARQIIAEAERIIELGHDHEDPLSGELKLGIISTLSAYLLPRLVPALRTSAPNLKLIPHEDLTNALIDRLRNHEIDAALLALPINAQDLESMPLFEEPFWAVLPTSHPLAKRKSITSKALSNEHLLLLTDGHCLRDQALDLCGRANIVAEKGGIDFRATSLETVHEMVSSGMGCTLMPAMAMTHHEKLRSPVACRPMSEKASRRIGLVYRSSYPLREDLGGLARIVVESLPNTVKRLHLS